MLVVAGSWLVRITEKVTVCDLSRSDNNVYTEETVPELLRGLVPGPYVQFSVQHEGDGAVLKVHRTNPSGLELKPLTVQLQLAEESTLTAMNEVVNDYIDMEKRAVGLKAELERVQAVLETMVDEKSEFQASSLRSIAAIIRERQSHNEMSLSERITD